MNIPAVRYVTLTAVTSVAAIVIATRLSSAPSQEWFIATAILFLLTLFGAALTVRVTASGSTTSINFLLHLGAIPLLGPAGAVLLAGLSTLIADVLIRDRSSLKVVFNVSQTIIATAVAALIYAATGPGWSLQEINLTAAVVPLFGGGILYFLTNSSMVAAAISTESGQSVREVWNDIAGPKYLLVYSTITPVSLSVPLLYVHWGPLGLLAIIVPIIGLRYSFGLNLELRNLNRDLLRVLVKTLEAQDPYTSGHSIRVSENARAIAKALGLRRRKLHHIETAALLHDIGKIGQDYSEILRQEGELTDDQRRLIKEHPDRGAEIVRPVRSLDPAVVNAIRHHHERYDGDGYPEGLAGENIPIGARVIMVADTIDAMATDRPYRQSLTAKEIQEELIRFANEQFDPSVVEAALEAGILESEPYRSEGSVV